MEFFKSENGGGGGCRDKELSGWKLHKATRWIEVKGTKSKTSLKGFHSQADTRSVHLSRIRLSMEAARWDEACKINMEISRWSGSTTFCPAVDRDILSSWKVLWVSVCHLFIQPTGPEYNATDICSTKGNTTKDTFCWTQSSIMCASNKVGKSACIFSLLGR